MRTIVAHAISAVASIGFTVLAVAASAPAAAATTDQAPRAIVRTADLDLASATGRRVALTRIGAAAVQVCDDGSADRLAIATCRGRAMASATQTLDRLGAPAQIAAR